MQILKPDTKGRIVLGKWAKEVTSYHATIDQDGKITLEPYTEIPLREKWLFANKEALKGVLQGLEESARGEVVSLGDFSKYLEDDTEDEFRPVIHPSSKK